MRNINPKYAANRTIGAVLFGLATACLLMALGGAAFAFKISVPDDIKNQSPEKQLQWINDQCRESRALQVKVGQERVEQRAQQKIAQGQEMAIEAQDRINLIMGIKRDNQERAQALANQENMLELCVLAIGAGAFALFAVRRWREARINASPRPSRPPA